MKRFVFIIKIFLLYVIIGFFVLQGWASGTGFAMGRHGSEFRTDFNGDVAWNTFIGSPYGGNTHANDIAIYHDGYVYFAGSSQGTWGNPVQPFTGYTEAFAVKIDSQGNLVWNTFIPLLDYGRAYGIAVDSDGNVYVAGYCATIETSYYLVDHDSGDLVLFVAKLDSNGNLLWKNTMGSDGYDFVEDIALDNNGNVHVTGYCDASWGTPVNAFAGDWDAFVIKLDTDGNLLWNTFLGSEDDDDGNALSVDSAGNVYLTGRSSAEWGDPIDGYANQDDVYVAELDADGHLLWNTFLGSDGSDIGEDISVDPNGNIYVMGVSYGSWGSPLNPKAWNDSDIFIAKLDGNGNLLWNTFMGVENGIFGAGLVLDDSGNMHIIGNCSNSWGSPVAEFSGGYDAVIIKMDAEGDIVWNTFMGTEKYDSGEGIGVDSYGNLYTTGFSEMIEEPLSGYSGNKDAFVTKLDNNGHLLWNTFYGEDGVNNGLDYCHGIDSDSDGNIYIVGSSDNEWDIPINAFKAMFDDFVAKLDSDGNLIWNTFLGSSDLDGAGGIALDILTRQINRTILCSIGNLWVFKVFHDSRGQFLKFS